MEAVTHYCPNCGGPLTFQPEDQNFHCPFCLSIFTPEELFSLENEKKEQAVDSSAEIEKKDNLELFLCPSCGAEIVTDATTAATYCYFCHNPVILKERLSGTFQPEKIIPFAISKKEATAQFLAWTKKKIFIPKNFFNQKQIEKLTGVYFPYWNVDAKTKGDFHGTGTKLRVWRIGEIEYTETKQYDVIRKGNISFSNLLKPALNKNLKEAMVTSIQPFNLSKAVDFKNAYLAGFQGEKRDVEYDELKGIYQQELKKYSVDLLKEQASEYNILTTKDNTFSIEEEKNHYLLLPVWLLTYRNPKNGEVFYYAMNGQTGKTAGKLPLHSLKLGLACGGIFFVVLLLSLLGGYFL